LPVTIGHVSIRVGILEICRLLIEKLRGRISVNDLPPLPATLRESTVAKAVKKITVRLPNGFEIESEGVDVEEFTELFKVTQIHQAGLNISHSTIGVLNTGVIENVGTMATHVKSLREAGEVQFADALAALTEAVTNSQELSQSQQREVLELLEELSAQ